jgi:prophage regulatory protein
VDNKDVDLQDLELYRLPRVMEIVGLGPTSIYEGVRDGTFPRPVKVIGRINGWVKPEIHAWVRQRIAAARTPPRGRKTGAEHVAHDAE